MPDQPTPDAAAAGADEPASDPPEPASAYDEYDVVDLPADLTARLAGALLPRRPAAGIDGLLLVDRDAGVVHLLDADDRAGLFLYRATREIAGSVDDLDYPRDGSDHLLRAAYEQRFDVVAAPWAGGTE